MNVDTVLVDNKYGAYQAVSYLIGLGHTRIGIIVDDLKITTNEERLDGYRSALEDHGISAEENLISYCQYTQQSAYQVAFELLRRSDRPTGLFTANNFISIGALRAIRDLELRIPGDISIVGFDEVDWSQLNYEQLTTVAQPVYDMGKIAAEKLIARLGGDSTPIQEIRLKTKFILRETCGPCQIPILQSG
jgi:LacI family transcriptional regulator